METSTTTPHESRETAADTIAKTVARVRDERDATERWGEVVRGHPITCLLAAVASGYLIGRIARRI